MRTEDITDSIRPTSMCDFRDLDFYVITTPNSPVHQNQEGHNNYEVFCVIESWF